MRPTLHDLAEAAGVSTATVDRVLNNRAGVSARTRGLVTDAARRIGYLPEAPGPTLHLAALLPGGPNPFIAELRAHLVAMAAAEPQVMLHLPPLSDLDPTHMADALHALGPCHGAAVIAPTHPLVHEALHRATARGIRVVTLASDLPDTRRLAYIGIDNFRAGRLAGQVITRFLGRSATGSIAAFAGTRSYRGHLERDMGLRQILAEDAPHLRVLHLSESREDPDRAYGAARAALQAHPDLVALYNAGGGTSGIARAVREAGRDIIFIAHEATAANSALLLDGTLDAVIDQDARHVAQEALATLIAAARGQDRTPIPPRLQLILRENLPTDPPPPAPA